MRFPFFRNRDSVKNGILISIRRTGDGFHPGLFIMEQMVKKQGATEELKAQDQMKWVRLMINIKSSAEEIVVKNTIYM